MMLDQREKSPSLPFSDTKPAMISSGLWIMTLLTLHSANLGESRTNSLNEPDVPFPPGRPNVHNLAAICFFGQGRPRYTAASFPRSGASHFRRRGKAINRLESWYGLCCGGRMGRNSYAILCCAQQAWKHALTQFCVDEYSTMTLAYECCQKRGEERWMCFDSDLPNPDYFPTAGYSAPTLPAEPGFNFDQSHC